MDPDLVRQQEEAERESLLVAKRKPEVQVAAVEHLAPTQTRVTAAFREAVPTPLVEVKGHSAAMTLWRLVMYSIAGAILGGAAGAALVGSGWLAEEAAVIKLSLVVAASLGCGAISLLRR